MTKLRSRSLVTQFRTLFAGGTLSGLGEGELLERFVGHRDEAAFAELVARHGPMVLAVCRRWLDDPHDVEDAFQATFLVLVRKAGGLRDRQSVAQWLYGVSHRVARHARAASIRRREREMRTVARRREPAGPDPADELAGREILATVHDELARLPEKQQTAAVLCLVQGLSHEAAARALGWPLGTLKTRIATARATLSRRLARRGVAPSCVAAVAGADFNLPVSSLSNELMRRTIDAALRLIADPAMKTGVIGASVASMVREVSRMMILARLGLVLVVLAALSAAVWAVSSLRISPAAIPQAADSSTGSTKAVARTQSKAGPENTPRRDLYGDPLSAGAVVRLGTVRYRQSSPIHRIAYSSDGKYVVTDGDDGFLRIWDAGDGRLVRRIDAGVGVIGDFALGSEPNTAMAVGTSFEFGPTRGIIRHVTRTDLTRGERLSKTSWRTTDFQVSLALCPDRQLLAIVSDAGPLRIINSATGAEVASFDTGNAVKRMTFSPDGKRLAVLRRRNDQRGLHENLVVLDVDGKKELTSLDVEVMTGNFAFSPDGSAIALISATNLKLWVLATGEVSSFKRIVKDYLLLQLSKVIPADRVAFSNDGRRLVAISNIGSISDCETSTRRLSDGFGFEAATMGSVIGPVAVSRDSRTLAAVGGSHVFHFWDLEAHRDRLAMEGAHSDKVNSILVSPDGKTLFTASDDGTIRLWDLASGRQRKVLRHVRWTDGEDPANRAATNRVVVMALSADGRLLASATDFSRRLYVWDPERADEPLGRTEEEESLGFRGPVAVRFEENNRSIVVLDQRGDLHLWDRRDPRLKPLKRPSLSKPDPPFASFPDDYLQGIFLADGKRLAVIGRFNGLQVADMVDAKELYRVEGANLLAASSDQRTLAIARNGSHEEIKWVPERDSARTPMLKKIPTDGTIVLLDSEMGKEKLQINVSGSEVRALAFSPDGKTLAATTGWESGQIHFFDVATGKEMRTIDTPPLQSPALAFTPDGSRLVSAMADGSVLVWDVKPLR